MNFKRGWRVSDNVPRDQLLSTPVSLAGGSLEVPAHVGAAEGTEAGTPMRASSRGYKQPLCPPPLSRRSQGLTSRTH